MPLRPSYTNSWQVYVNLVLSRIVDYKSEKEEFRGSVCVCVCVCVCVWWVLLSEGTESDPSPLNLIRHQAPCQHLNIFYKKQHIHGDT